MLKNVVKIINIYTIIFSRTTQMYFYNSQRQIEQIIGSWKCCCSWQVIEVLVPTEIPVTSRGQQHLIAWQVDRRDEEDTRQHMGWEKMTVMSDHQVEMIGAAATYGYHMNQDQHTVINTLDMGQVTWPGQVALLVIYVWQG